MVQGWIRNLGCISDPEVVDYTQADIRQLLEEAKDDLQEIAMGISHVNMDLPQTEQNVRDIRNLLKEHNRLFYLRMKLSRKNQGTVIDYELILADYNSASNLKQSIDNLKTTLISTSDRIYGEQSPLDTILHRGRNASQPIINPSAGSSGSPQPPFNAPRNGTSHGGNGISLKDLYKFTQRVCGSKYKEPMKTSSLGIRPQTTPNSAHVNPSNPTSPMINSSRGFGFLRFRSSSKEVTLVEGVRLGEVRSGGISEVLDNLPSELSGGPVSLPTIASHQQSHTEDSDSYSLTETVSCYQDAQEDIVD